MYTALKGFRVQGSGFRVQGSGFREIRNEELEMRNEGGGFAANIYGDMGRCSKVVCKSLVLRFPNHWHGSQLLSQVRSEE